MHSEMSTPLFPGRAPPRRSPVQHSQGLTCHEDWDCQLEHGHHTAASVDTLESRYPGPSSGGARDVSISEALQLPSSPSQVLARNSGAVGYSSREPDACQFLSILPFSHRVHRSHHRLDNAVDQNRPSSIDPCLVNHTRDSRVMQGHASDYTTNHGSTFPPSYTSFLLLLHASTFGVPGNSFAVPTMGLGPIPSSHNGTTSQVIDSNAPRPQPPNPVRPSLQEPHPRLPALAYPSTHQSRTHPIPVQLNVLFHSDAEQELILFVPARASWILLTHSTSLPADL